MFIGVILRVCICPSPGYKIAKSVTSHSAKSSLRRKQKMERGSHNRNTFQDVRHLEELVHTGSGLHLALGAALGGSGPSVPNVPRGAAKRKAVAFPSGLPGLSPVQPHLQTPSTTTLSPLSSNAGRAANLPNYNLMQSFDVFC